MKRSSSPSAEPWLNVDPVPASCHAGTGLTYVGSTLTSLTITWHGPSGMSAEGVQMGLRELAYKLYERRLEASLSPHSIPRHVGVILDGNRRWARSAGLTDVSDGHQKGADNIFDGRFFLHGFEKGSCRLSVNAVLGLLPISKPPTTNQRRKSTTKHKTIDAKNPNIVLPLDNPLGERDTHRSALWTIRIIVFDPVLLYLFVRETSRS